MTDRRRDLPSVDRLLAEPGIQALLATTSRDAVVDALRTVLARSRSARAPIPEDWASEVREQLDEAQHSSLRPIINGTGIVLHTNLGRAPLARAALAAVQAIAGGYSSLEFDLATGSRGSRADHCRELLTGITGAEDALVLNNAAGALVVALNTAAAGRAILISRGELIEIGGSFRIPDILVKSGAALREVGTTNRTHLRDYEAALDTDAGAILTVHRSNFELKGFVTTPTPAELGALAHRHNLPYLYDIGSGLLTDLSAWGLRSEPRVSEALASGADAVLFSGDKLLGGPQAGIVVGRSPFIAACARNPLARALRADKMTLAALEATLRLYRDPEQARRDIPVLRMLTESSETLRERAGRLRAASPASLDPRLEAGESAAGGGSFPDAALPTTLVTFAAGAPGADSLALRLRRNDPPIVARVQTGRVVIDPRTLTDADTATVASALQHLAQELEAEK